MGGWLGGLENFIEQKWDQFTQWLKSAWEGLMQFYADVYEDFTGYLKDLVHDGILAAMEAFLKFAVAVLEDLPVPEFMTQTSIGEILGQAGPWVAWLGGTLRLQEAFGFLAAGWTFRIFRKVATLGRW